MGETSPSTDAGALTAVKRCKGGSVAYLISVKVQPRQAGAVLQPSKIDDIAVARLKRGKPNKVGLMDISAGLAYGLSNRRFQVGVGKVHHFIGVRKRRY